MKNPFHPLLLLFGLFLSTSLPAQPVLTAAQLPQAGDVLVQDWMNTAPNQVPNEGANVTWDLSQNTFNSLEDSGVYVNLSSTLPGWNYNLAFQYYSATQPKLDLYELYPGELRYAGYDRADQAFDTLVLSTSSLLLPVPLTYGGSFAQSIGGYYANNGNNIPLSGTTFLDADAYGTLLLPWATYTNVLRVHVRDSLSVFGFPQINDSYYYYTPTEPHPLMVIQQKNPPTGYAIKRGAPLGIAHEELPPQIKLYPNPATKQAFLDLSTIGMGDARVEIRDMAGRAVLEMKASGPGRLMVLDVADLPKGMYIVRVSRQNEGWSWQKRLVVQ